MVSIMPFWCRSLRIFDPVGGIFGDMGLDIGMDWNSDLPKGILISSPRILHTVSDMIIMTDHYKTMKKNTSPQTIHDRSFMSRRLRHSIRL
jgi:hypothetical protein